MHVRVLVAVVIVVVFVEETTVPAHEQQHCERDDQNTDCRLRRALHGLRQVRAVQHDWEPEDEQRRRVAKAPGEPQPRGTSGCALASRGNQRRDRREVVRVACMPKAEHDGHRGDDQQRRPI